MARRPGREGRPAQARSGQTFHAMENYEETVGSRVRLLLLRKNAAQTQPHGCCGEHETVVLSTQYSRDSARLFDPNQTPWGDTL